MQHRSLLRAALALSALFTLACSGDFWRSCTAKVVGKTVETSKEVGTGIVEGIQDGRKAGESVDGAAIVSSFAELEPVGKASVYAVEPGETEGSARVTVAFENSTDKPLRLTELSLELLDTEGFVQRAEGRPDRELTVPPKAKDRVSATFPVPPEKVGEVRLWGQAVPR